MGLLDDLLYNASPDNGPGLLGYLTSGRTGSVPAADPNTKAATADELATALGINNISASQDLPPAPAAGAPQVPISQPSPMTSPVTAPQFGANPSPYLFPQSAAFGASAPTPAFGQGASPLSFPQSQAFGGNPPTPAKPPVVATDDDEEDTPSAPQPQNASPIAVGGVQMPRIGPASAFTPQAAAAPAQPAAATSSPGSGILQHIGAALNSVGAPNSLFHNLVTNPVNALITGQTAADTEKSNRDQIANITARALIAKGVDPQTVLAAVQPGNTEMLKALLPALSPQAYTQETDKDGNVWNVNKQTGQKTVALQQKDDKFQHVQTGEAFGGQKTFGSFNTKTGEIKTDAGASGAPGSPAIGSLLAQGVTYDPNKSGEDYMAQFSPEVQAAAKAYMNGDVMPTGNARKDSIVTLAKTIAQKYGQDTGVPVSDATYAAKRKMQTDLASSGNSTMGGILSNGESSFKHLAEYTVSAADQGNASHNFPLGGALAHAQNYIGNSGGGSDTQGKVKAINDNLGKYGAEATKFYAGTGGGVEERLNALKEMNAVTTSGEEAASYAEKEKSLMLDRLNTKFQEIRNTLGEERGNAEIAKHMPDIQKNVATIDANIAKLRGKGPDAAPNAKPSVVTQNGHTYNLQPDGSYK